MKPLFLSLSLAFLPALHAADDYTPVDLATLAGYKLVVPTLDAAHPEVVGKEMAKIALPQIPKSIWALSGKKVRITGFVIPAALKDGRLTHFLIVPCNPDDFEGLIRDHGFEEMYGMYVSALAPQGIRAVSHNAGDGPSVFRGTFTVGAVLEDGAFVGVYRIDVDQEAEPVRPKAPETQPKGGKA